MFTDILMLLALVKNQPTPQPQVMGVSAVTIASRGFSLQDRYGNNFVNEVFKENILLTVKYMGSDFTLEPGQTFAFDDKVLPEYSGKISKTTWAHFISSEGFKSDGYLIGDGVCHLASLINWVALDAGLTVIAPRNHNFAVIPEVPKEYGVSIMSSDPFQNLYITNNLDKPVTFVFESDGTSLNVRIVKEN
jgi:vancomycin resistance protein YoaR